MTSQENLCDVSVKINSDLQALSPALQDSIKKIIEKKHFAQYEVTVKNLNTNANNFLGKLYEINIKCVTPEFKKDIDLFVKEKIVLEKMTIVSVDQIYGTEKLVYKELSKIMTNVQDKANVPLEERFNIAKAYDETNDDVIILENLRRRGFTIYGKAETLPFKVLELGVQQLAKLHALTFVIEKELPEYFENNLAVLENPLNLDEDWTVAMRMICTYVANLYDGETKEKVENFVPVILEKLPKYQKDKTKICTLSHGDYKKNNIMVRLVNGEPADVVSVDYQFFDYGCPMRDLLFFIFSGTDREFRKKHLNDLKELYFETLSRFLKYFDMDVETVYPREEFEKLYTEWLDYGLMATLFASLVMFAPDTEVDVEQSNLSELPYCPGEKYDYILRGLIDDFVQWGYL